MQLKLEKNWQDYIERQIEAGRFETADDVVQDALRMQMDYFSKRDALRDALQSGLESIKAGRTSRATPADIKRIAAERKRSA